MNPSDLSAWYKKRPIILWVEDALTRTYLRELWQDPQLSFLVAGGNDAVVAAVRDARSGEDSNVFGFRDRDFLEPNVDDWGDPTKQPHVFRPRRHEVENYLVRPDILAELPPDLNPRRRTRSDLDEQALVLATGSLWWMVCRAVLSDARHCITQEFPPHPSWGRRGELGASPVLEHLHKVLVSSAWGDGVEKWVDAARGAWISERLEFHRGRYQAALDDGTWQELWSGKDIFKELPGYVNIGKKQAVAADELAKAVGRWQRWSEPRGELWDLHAALRWRAGCGPAPAATPATPPPGTA